MPGVSESFVVDFASEHRQRLESFIRGGLGRLQQRRFLRNSFMLDLWFWAVLDEIGMAFPKSDVSFTQCFLFERSIIMLC